MKPNGIEEQYVIDDFTSKDTWRIFRHYRRRSRRDGGGKQGRRRGRRGFDRVEHRVAAGTETEHLREQASQLPIFLRTESHVCEVLYRIRDSAWRIRNAR